MKDKINHIHVPDKNLPYWCNCCEHVRTKEKSEMINAFIDRVNAINGHKVPKKQLEEAMKLTSKQ